MPTSTIASPNPASDRDRTTRRPPLAGSDRQCNRFQVVSGIASVLVLALAATGCTSRPTHTAAKPTRVSIYGIDGATWKVIDPLLAAGELPNLDHLIRNGTRAPLRSRKPLVSPPVWTTIATGVPRGIHGIRNFIVKGKAARTRPGGRLVSSRDRKAHALWTIASEHGVRSAVLGWWATYPAEAIDGVVVSERALKTRESDLTSLFGGRETSRTALVYPPEIMPSVAAILGASPEPADSGGEREERAEVLKSMQIEDRALARSLLVLRETRGPFRLEMVLMRGVDVISHHFWKFYEPDSDAYREEDRPTAEEVAREGSTVTDHYRFVDRLIGELVAENRPGDVVMIVSDHGFEAGMQPYRKGVLSGTHKSDAALDGIFIASGGPVRRGTRLPSVSILDIAPTALYLLELPIAKNLRGRPVEEALVPQWREAHAVQRVDAYDGPAVLLPDKAPNGESPVDDAVMEQLRGLGYVE